MNGPTHYVEAESLLKFADHAEGGSSLEAYNLAAAQVHATLALAAATALPSVLSHGDSDDKFLVVDEPMYWARVIS